MFYSPITVSPLYLLSNDSDRVYLQSTYVVQRFSTSLLHLA